MSNPVIDCLMSHRSIRRYKSTRIDETTIETLIEAGTRAATAGNLQLYTFLVVDDPEKIAIFEEELGPVISPPPLIIVALLDLHRIRRWLEVNDASTPVLHRPAYFMLGLWDALIALQNVCVAAESLGLGTCYYGSIQEMDVQKHFGTPQYVFPAGMLCLGYPDSDPELSRRLPLAAVYHMNSYQHFDDATIKEHYRERDAVWEKVGEERKAQLEREGIHNIPQALAKQRFSDEITRERSRGVMANLRRAGFEFE